MKPHRPLEYYPVELEPWPGVIITVALGADGRLWFPVRPICAVLRIDLSSQLQKLKGDDDFADLTDDVPIPTATRGMRNMLCVEFEGLGGWLTGISSGRVRPEVRDNVRRFRRTSWAAANEVLLGRRVPVPVRPLLRGSQGERLTELMSIVLQVEERIGAIEQQVYVPESDDDAPVMGEAAVTCPYCHRPFPVQLAPLAP